MKKYICKILSLLLFLSASTTLVAQINVMDNYNGDFEFGTFDHWRFVEVADSMSGSYAEITENSFEGNYAAQITWSSETSGIIDMVFDNWGSKVEVVAGNTYTLNAAVMTIEDSGLLLHCTLGFFNAAGTVINEKTKNWTLNDFFEVKELVGIAPPGATNCWIAFRLFAENGARWPAKTGITLIDNVELWETPPEETSAGNNLSPEIKLYPNPVQEVLHIESENNIISIEVYNIQGTKVKKTIEKCSTINMADLSSGLYLLKVSLASETFIQTIIKE